MQVHILAPASWHKCCLKLKLAELAHIIHIHGSEHFRAPLCQRNLHGDAGKHPTNNVWGSTGNPYAHPPTMQAADAQQQLAECHAEWEVKLQMLRQDKAALTAQLRKAMVRGLCETTPGCLSCSVAQPIWCFAGN